MSAVEHASLHTQLVASRSQWHIRARLASRRCNQRPIGRHLRDCHRDWPPSAPHGRGRSCDDVARDHTAPDYTAGNPGARPWAIYRPSTTTKAGCGHEITPIPLVLASRDADWWCACHCAHTREAPLPRPHHSEHNAKGTVMTGNPQGRHAVPLGGGMGVGSPPPTP